jgi:hypothetical protein
VVTAAYEAARTPGSSFEMHVFEGKHELGDEEKRARVVARELNRRRSDRASGSGQQADAPARIALACVGRLFRRAP